MNITPTLAALPLELQLEILHHVPPNELFVLRRVSHAWNTMLSNTNLLEAINATIPFLTSAPDLTTRMKRRMRMWRGEPVWVKPLEEAFPWASDDLNHYKVDDWQTYSDGYLVFLKGPVEDQVRRRSSPVITLNIKGLHQHIMHHVDIIAVLKEVNLEVYREWIEDGSEGRVDVTRFHFNVQEGKAVVGLQATKEGLDSSGWTRRISCGTYFLIFSLENRELVQQIYTPHSPATCEQFILTRLNATHVMYLYGRESASAESNLHRVGSHEDQYRTHERYEIEIYALAAAATRDPQPKSYEIVITDPNSHLRIVGPELPSKGFTPFFVGEASERYGFATEVVLDHLGRVWFPSLEGSIITTTLGNTPAENNNIRGSIHMHELPRTGCSRWVIIDPPAILSGLERPDPVVTPHSQPLSETTFGSFHQWLQMVEFPFEGPRSWGRARSLRIQKFIPNTQRALPIRGYSEINTRIPLGAAPRGGGSSLIAGTPASWGYMIPVGYHNIKHESWVNFSKNLYIMPLHGGYHDDVDKSKPYHGYSLLVAIARSNKPRSELLKEKEASDKAEATKEKKELEEAEAAGWKLVCNGLPYAQPHCLPPIENAQVDSATAKWVWGDDGILCFEIGRAYTRVGELGLPPIMTSTRWLVCYEENWSI